MSRGETSRPGWRLILSAAFCVAKAAENPAAVLNGPAAIEPALVLRRALRVEANAPFCIAGASMEGARMAFVFLGKAVLDAGLPAQRLRLARMLATVAAELDGLMDDDAAAANAESRRRIGDTD